MAKPNGAVIFEGDSLIDGSPIVVIATGLKGTSANEKTGDMVQTWILRRDMSPMDAVKSGADAGICGDCKHRGVRTDDLAAWAKPRTCYVTVIQAPRSVFAAYQRGTYPRMSAAEVSALIGARPVRLGSYGDPAAVPFEVWAVLVSGAKSHTGYTHQWTRCDPRLRGLCMASVDTYLEYLDARAAGWRTFRVRAPFEPLQEADKTLGREIICPASHERPLTTCERCGLCDGARGENGADRRATIAILAHGSGASSFVSAASLRSRG